MVLHIHCFLLNGFANGQDEGSTEFCSVLQRVVLHFEKFDLESADGECPLDKVTIFDGSDSTDRTLATLCGNKLPADVVSSYSTLLVVFSSDSTRTAPGFWATYTTKPEGMSLIYPMSVYPASGKGYD